LWQVKINSVDVTADMINCEYEETYGDLLPEINMEFVKRINTTLGSEVTPGMTLEIWRGWVTATDEKKFSGYVELVENDSGKVIITGLNKIWDLVRKEVNTVYNSSVHASAGKISAIFLDLVTTYGGLNADATTVQDSGTVYVLEKFVCNHTDIFERCKALAEVLDWQFYYRADTDMVYFEPKGFTTNGNILTVGVDIIKLPSWKNDITEMVNDVTIVGAYQEIETTKSGRIGTTSGFTTASVTIDYEPISVKLYADSSNPPTTLKTGGVVGSTASYYYSVDKPQKIIYPAPATTFTTNDYVEVRYSFAAPIPINVYNQTSKDAYGEFKKTITYNDIRGIADAENRGTNYLIKYSTPFIYSTLKVKNASSYNLAVGQSIRIIDTKNTPNVDKILVINKLRLRYPTDYDEIDVGDRYWRLSEFQANVMEKFKRIEEDEFANQEIITNIITVDNVPNNYLTLDNRYAEALTQTMTAPNVFILGNVDFARLGTDKLGDAGAGAETLYWRAQKDNIYTENFTDALFKDTTDSGTNPLWTTNMSGYWKLEDLEDSTPGNHDLTNYTATSGVAGKIGNCYSFDGNDYMTLAHVPNSTSNGNYTVRFWVYFDVLNATDQIILGAHNGQWDPLIQTYNTSKLVFQWANSYYVITNASTIATGGWYHVVCTYDHAATGAQGKLYLNGSKITSFSASAYGGRGNGAISTVIGKNPIAANSYFKGKLDELMFASRTWSDAEILEDYNGGAGLQYGSLVPSTTATWTNTGSVTFTSGQVATSIPIDYNNGIITAANMSVTKNNGTLTYEMTTNGTNWETATGTSTLTFANTGTLLQWRITETGASTAEVTNVTINSYH
jgi:hypothetical protein